MPLFLDTSSGRSSRRTGDRLELHRDIPFGLFLLAPCLILGLASCGIEEYVLLNSPQEVTTNGATTIEFKHDTGNDDPSIFTGYDVYYRLFADSDAASSTLAGVDDQLDSQTPDTLHTRIKAAKYQPMIAIDAEDEVYSPIFRMVDDNAAVTTAVKVQFTLDEYGTIRYDGSEKDIVIRRYSSDSFGDYRGFADFTSDDSTGTSSTSDCAYPSSQSVTQAYFRGYIFATGVDIARQFKTYYSAPVLIGGGAISLP